MFRAMRRKKQLLSEAETIEILQTCTSGVLAVTGDEGYPYAAPLSYAYEDGKLYFHVAKDGHKLDGIARNNKVSFCVIQLDKVSASTFTTHFRSVIVFGRARILTEDSEKRCALECLVEKYSPGYVKEGQAEIEREWQRVCAVEVSNTVLVIEHNLELIKTADWVIDLGPEGGAAGGQLVAQGTPEQVAQVPQSYTGQCLRDILNVNPA